jgi:hypothetical protein
MKNEFSLQKPIFIKNFDFCVKKIEFNFTICLRKDWIILDITHFKPCHYLTIHIPFLGFGIFYK